MKKIVFSFLAAFLFVFEIGCGNKIAEKEQANYVVVEISDGTNVNDLFEFQSVSKVALGGEVSKLGIQEGCYCIGRLQGKNSIVWRADDDGTGYDDCLFIYVEQEVSNVQVTSYVSKLGETPISYDSFKEEYNNI